MKLIENFEQDSFLDIIWVSEKAKSVWKPVIDKCSEMVQDLEIDSVEEGQRKCAWRSINENDLPRFSIALAERGLIVLPIKYTGTWEGFSHKTLEVIPGKPKNVYTIIARNHKDAIEFRNYHEAGDHDGQGKMLGFPKCCRDAFKKHWGDGYFDPIWQISKNIDSFNTEPHPYSNPVLRYIGLRVGFHIPCSFNCKDTIGLSEERLELAKKKDPDLVKLLEALLSMPMSWEVLHGVAIVSTPIFYIKTSSVPSTEKFRLDLSGSFIPKESKKGINHPFSEVKNGIC